MNNDYWEKVKKHATPLQAKKIDLSLELGSNSKAAAELGIDRRGVDRAIESAIEKALAAGEIMDEADNLKILLIDIETAPLLGYFWRLWSEIRGLDQIERDWYCMSYCYKWLDNDEVYGKSLYECTRYGEYEIGTEDDRELIEDLWELLNEADIVIGHNGDNFDLKKIKARMLQHVMIPPAPYRTVDTLKIMKREFGLTSNKLDYAAGFLFGDAKLKTDLNLWIDCVKGSKKAWNEMLDYNKKDVDLLERVYKRIRSWDRSHPNVNVLLDGDKSACPVCASTDLKLMKDKFAPTNLSKFQAFRCGDCGHVMRGRQNERSKEATQKTLLNAR
jgi:hypothetical protein